MALSVPTQIHVVDGGVGKSMIQGRTATVIRGTLMPEFFGAVKVPDYQRIAMKNRKHHELIEALGPDGIGVPDDLMLCVRHDNFTVVGAGEFVIDVPPNEGIVLLDGHQRMAAAWELLRLGATTQFFGVKLFLGTSLREEIATFYQVNRLQTPVSTHVLLRNSGDTPAIKALREMSQRTPDFPQVQWDQLKQKGDILTAHKLLETAVVLHGYARGFAIEEIRFALDETSKSIGTELLVHNVATFFKVLHECFDTVEQRPYMYRTGLLVGLARLFAGHNEFWDKRDKNKLLVRAPEKNVIKGTSWRHLDGDLRLSSPATAITDRLVRRIDSQREKNRLTLRMWNVD